MHPEPGKSFAQFWVEYPVREMSVCVSKIDGQISVRIAVKKNFLQKCFK